MRAGSTIAPPIVSSGGVDRLAEGRSPASPKRADGSTRVTSAIVAMFATAILVVAWVLQPSADGLGTHRQLGLPACGWIASADLPCPTCGMTTAFSHAAHGDLPSSFRAQPLGMMLAVGTAIVALAGVWTACSGSMLAPFLAAMLGPRLGWTLGVLLLLAWGWKILDHKGLLL
jgi:hypothetical protein